MRTLSELPPYTDGDGAVMLIIIQLIKIRRILSTYKLLQNME